METKDKILESMIQGSCKELDADFEVTKRVYMDLVLFKDLRLGHVLSTCKEHYNHIIEHLDDYNRRLDKSFCQAFPLLKDREQELSASYKDNPEIINYAPDTILSHAFVPLIQNCYEHNKLTENRDTIEVVLNAYPLPISEPLEACVMFMQEIFKGNEQSFQGKDFVKFTLISQDPLTIPTSVWDSFQLIFIDELYRISGDEQGAWTELLETGKWYNKRIYTPEYLSEEGKESYHLTNFREDTEEYQLVFDLTSETLNTFCKFLFINVGIPRG